MLNFGLVTNKEKKGVYVCEHAVFRQSDARETAQRSHSWIIDLFFAYSQNKKH